MTIQGHVSFASGSIGRTIRNVAINGWPDLFLVNRFLRPAAARLCGMMCGPKVTLQKRIFYGNPTNVCIGDYSCIGRGVFLDGFSRITIGKRVFIAFQTTLITSAFEGGSEQGRTGEVVGKPIVIGDGVWVGAGALIGPGVTIGEGSIIAAGAALMCSVPPNSLVAGVPGRVVARLLTSASQVACSGLRPEEA
jgi:maltose O-acetyltransferase